MSEDTVVEALIEFNRLHNRELSCTLISADEEGFTVRFTGTFCETCGFFDYFDDLMILFEDQHGQVTTIEKIDETPGGAHIRYVFHA